MQLNLEAHRQPILQDGEGRLTFGAGTWMRFGEGSLAVGNLDLRWGLLDRVELRVLLPGLAFLLVREEEWRPSVVLFAGMTEVGFDTSVGRVLAYGTGVGLSKLLHPRVRVRLFGEFRHRPFGEEEIQLAVPGPLPSARAWLTYGDVLVQIRPELAASVGAGGSIAIGDGQDFAWLSFGVTATLLRRTDVFLQLLLASSRGDRAIDPAVFGGVSFGF